MLNFTDVLMVWHAFLLNPSWYQRYKERSLKYLHSVMFPWNEIVSDASKHFAPQKLDETI